MFTHRFIYTSRAGAQTSEALEFRNDEMAIMCARALLSAETIAVAIRRSAGGVFEPVGLWIWNHGAPQWKPGE